MFCIRSFQIPYSHRIQVVPQVRETPRTGTDGPFWGNSRSRGNVENNRDVKWYQDISNKWCNVSHAPKNKCRFVETVESFFMHFPFRHAKRLISLPSDFNDFPDCRPASFAFAVLSFLSFFSFSFALPFLINLKWQQGWAWCLFSFHSRSCHFHPWCKPWIQNILTNSICFTHSYRSNKWILSAERCRVTQCERCEVYSTIFPICNCT